MAFKRNFIILVPILWLTFNIKGLECKNPGRIEMPKRAGDFNKALNQASQMITEFPYGISDAVDDASGVFGNILNMIFSKKKFLGIESFYYK